MQYLDAISKMTEWSLFVSKANHSVSVIQVYALTSNAEEVEVEWFYEDLQDLLELTPKKDVLFITGTGKKSRKSRRYLESQQIWPWSTEWSRAKTNRVLPRECTGHSKHPLPITQERLYTWSSPDCHHWNQIDYILCSQRWRSSIQSAKTRHGADCGWPRSSVSHSKIQA